MAVNPVSNKELFDAMGAINTSVNNIRVELKGDIASAVAAMAQNHGRLERKFDDLEAGRLTRAEGLIQDLRVQMIENRDVAGQGQAVLKTKFAVILSICIIVFQIVITITIARLLGA